MKAVFVGILATLIAGAASAQSSSMKQACTEMLKQKYSQEEGVKASVLAIVDNGGLTLYYHLEDDNYGSWVNFEAKVTHGTCEIISQSANDAR